VPSFEGLLLLLLLALLAAGALGLWSTLRRPSASSALEALGQGRFADALETARIEPPVDRGELYAAAVAAKHLLQLERAGELLDRILVRDPGDGEAWLERGLVAAYAGDLAGAERAFARVEPRRSDLLESLTLHRAWLALRRGDPQTAQRLFSEIEAPLANKLRSDLGSGEPLFCEWFLQAAALWRAAGNREEAEWAHQEGRSSAPESRLADVADPDLETQPPLQ
jgi:tetratricopeptide (TPR) repeat protein